MQDARVDVPQDVELKLLAYYARLRREADRGFDVAGFARAYAILGAQRATKILGIFARLDERDHKPQYLAHLPRVEEYLAKNLAHPALAELKLWYEEHLPRIPGLAARTHGREPCRVMHLVELLRACQTRPRGGQGSSPCGPLQIIRLAITAAPQMSSFMPAKAMVFAAGLGTRMRPLTDRMPKPLIAVAGKPLIDHTLDRFAAAGVETAIVNVHYLADQIEAHLAARKAPKILISDEREKLLDQGGGIAKVLPLLGPEPFFLANTDAFWVEGPADNLRRLAAAWDPDKMDILLLVAAVAASVGVDSPGDFNMAPDGRLTRRPGTRNRAFRLYRRRHRQARAFRRRRRAIFFRSRRSSSRRPKTGRLFGRRLDGLWFHVGTPQAIEEAERKLARGRI